jgi:pSer/pThr/pTyr-binding forkhead associated (FHA) protein
MVGNRLDQVSSPWRLFHWQNAVVLDSPKVSRRHAIINVQNVGEFCLIDLGSSNGTFLSKRRIHQPLRRCDYDQIVIGDSVFTFRQPEELTDDFQTTFVERTVLDFADALLRWLRRAMSRHPKSRRISRQRRRSWRSESWCLTYDLD